ncbi:amidohydrolase family protein [Emcibacteraceae bacterium]|nr:amidohydrolase family protein [Emcibacteraceae bacterium]
MDVELIISGGVIVTIDDQRRVIKDGAIVINNGQIIAVDQSTTIQNKFNAKKTINASGKVIIPGLIDTHAHAGHALIKTMGLNADWEEVCGDIYRKGSTPEFWYAEARLASLERLKFGVTTGVSLLGGGDTILRTDDPVYADAHCEGVASVGTRSMVAVGPTRAPHPLNYASWDNDDQSVYPVSFEKQIKTCEKIITNWHRNENKRISIAAIYPVLRNEHEKDMSATDYEEAIRQAKITRDLSKAAGLIFTQDGHTGGSVKRSYEIGLLGPDALLSHATNLSAEEIEICAKTNTRIAHNPSAVAAIYGYCPVIELMEKGVIVAIGSDATAPDRSSDMFRHMQQLMHYHRTHYRDASVMPAGKALEMATIDAATALGMDDEIGSIEVGKKADIVLVDMDAPHVHPMNMEAFRVVSFANGNDVDTVIIGGEVVLENKKPTRVKVTEVLNDAQAETEKMLSRTDGAKYLELPDGFWSSTHYTK